MYFDYLLCFPNNIKRNIYTGSPPPTLNSFQTHLCKKNRLWNKYTVYVNVHVASKSRPRAARME